MGDSATDSPDRPRVSQWLRKERGSASNVVCRKVGNCACLPTGKMAVGPRFRWVEAGTCGEGASRSFVPGGLGSSSNGGAILIIARGMTGTHVDMAKRHIGTGIDALLAPLACLRVIDTGMAVLEENDLPEDTVGTRLDTSPAGLAGAPVEFDVLWSLCGWSGLGPFACARLLLHVPWTSPQDINGVPRVVGHLPGESTLTLDQP
jgi:hypothetical protein